MTNRGSTFSGDACVIFVHIPKAGGTTLQNIVERQYAARRIYTTHGEFEHGWDSCFRHFGASRASSYDLIRGHMYFGLHEYTAKQARYITMLRDPVQRVVSLYHYARRTPQHYLYGKVHDQGYTLGDLLAEGAHTELSNGQTRILAGRPASPGSGGACTEGLLERARRNLEEHFVGCGLMERFDESVLLFADSLNWSTPYYMRRNATPRGEREAIPTDVLAEVERQNTLDISLYQHAEQWLENALRERPHIRDTLPRFRHENAGYGKYVALSNIMHRGILRRLLKLQDAYRRQTRLFRPLGGTPGS